MLISGFTFLRNAHKLYYPIEESIRSILDLVDEFVIALGDGDSEDTSLAILKKINSPKIKIIHTVWDMKTHTGGSIYAQQTQIAKQACQGSWLIYLQGDEVIHEDDILEIREALIKYKENTKVEGFVFNYLHFYGDYQHYFSDHCWYKKEIRIVRNLPEIYSWRDAQSFRLYTNPHTGDYHTSVGNRKLKCITLNASVFHYGWVRPPQIMKLKSDTIKQNYQTTFWKEYDGVFDYGRLDYCKVFINTHPKVMTDKIKALDWNKHLRFSGPVAINRSKMKHERPKYRILSWIEENLLGGYVIGGFKNFELVKP